MSELTGIANDFIHQRGFRPNTYLDLLRLARAVVEMDVIISTAENCVDSCDDFCGCVPWPEMEGRPYESEYQPGDLDYEEDEYHTRSCDARKICTDAIKNFRERNK